MRLQRYITSAVLLAAFAASGPDPIGFAAARELPATKTLTIDSNPIELPAAHAVLPTKTLTPYHPSLRGTHAPDAVPHTTLGIHADPLPDPAPAGDPHILSMDAVTAMPALPAVEAPAASVDGISAAGGLAMASIGSRTARALQQMKLACMPKQFGCLMEVQAAKTVAQGPGPAPGPKTAKPDPALAVVSGKIGGSIPGGGKGAPTLVQQDLSPIGKG